MDFVRRVLDFFKDKVTADPSEFYSFAHFLEENQSEYVATVQGEPDGYLVFCIFSHDEWAMVVDICELTNRNACDVVRELADDNAVMNIVVDPRDMS